MGLVRKSRAELGAGHFDHTKVEATTEADIRQHLIEDGFDPDRPFHGLVETSSGNVVGEFLLTRAAPIDRPVSVARALRSAGLTLSEAHGLLNRIVNDETVRITLHGEQSVLVATLHDLGVSAVCEG